MRRDRLPTISRGKVLDYCSTISYNYIVEQKGGDPLSGKKLGRPTDNPKPYRLGIRVDEKTLTALDTYCQEHTISRSDAVRIAVERLVSEQK